MSGNALTDRGVSGGQIVAYALGYQGVPYRWGGTSPQTGFDCSGFAQYVYGHYGYTLPRTSQEQATTGVAVAFDDLLPGDLLFFNSPGEGTNSHEGIYIGNRAFIHAPHTGDVVKISSLSGYYIQVYSTARRIITAGTGAEQGNAPAPGTAVTRQTFANSVLAGIGAPLTKNNQIVMVAWQVAEGTAAKNNPYATTQRIRGTGGADSTDFNSVGVQNYKNTYQGTQATVATLSNGRYVAILADLHRSADPHVTAQAITASSWGTKNLSGPLIDQVAADYSRYANQSIGAFTSDDKNVPGGIGDVVPGLGGVSDLLGNLLKVGTWIRVVEVVVGAAIVLGILFILVRQNA